MASIGWQARKPQCQKAIGRMIKNYKSALCTAAVMALSAMDQVHAQERAARSNERFAMEINDRTFASFCSTLQRNINKVITLDAEIFASNAGVVNNRIMEISVGRCEATLTQGWKIRYPRSAPESYTIKGNYRVQQARDSDNNPSPRLFRLVFVR
jgi:hypothetical protein